MSRRSEDHLVEGVIVNVRPAVDPDEPKVGEVHIYEHDRVVDVDIQLEPGAQLGLVTWHPTENGPAAYFTDGPVQPRDEADA